MSVPHLIPTLSPEEFYKHVDTTGDCWIWTRARNGQGYGALRVPGIPKQLKAHRVAYELAKGPIADGLVLMHLCDNPPCVRPDHLKPGTPSENTRDAFAKGRQGLSRARDVQVAMRLARRECSHGHPYTEQNLRIENGHRRCRTCHREQMATARASRRSAS